MRKTWLAVGVVSLGLAGLPPTEAFAQRDRNDRADQRRQIERTPMHFGDLPGPVKQAVGEERGQRRVISTTRIVSNGHTTYRVIVRGADGREEAFRVRPNGEVIAVRNLTEEGDVHVRLDTLPGPVKDTLTREAGGQHFEDIVQVTRDKRTWFVAELADGRVIRVDSDGEIMGRPRLLSERGRELEFDEDDRQWQYMQFGNLPGEVKQTVAQQRGGDTVTDVVKVTQGNRTVYRVRVEGPNQARIIRVDQSGRLLSVDNATEEGRVRMNFDTLPGPVKSTLIREAQGRNISRVTQVTRSGRTWYVAEVPDRDQPRMLRVDHDGRLMGEWTRDSDRPGW